MPIYGLICEDCGVESEEFHHLSAWKGLKEEETPFEKVCPQCGSINYHRLFRLTIFTETSVEQRKVSLKKIIAEDTKKLKNGDMDFIRNIAGDKPISGNSGVKYMKDVKNPKIKRSR